jgi:hypothetical protein
MTVRIRQILKNITVWKIIFLKNTTVRKRQTFKHINVRDIISKSLKIIFK